MRELTFGLLALLLVSCGQERPEAKNGQVATAIVDKIDWSPAKNYLHSATNQFKRNIQSVGLISLPSQNSRCTAFLISENVLMTNAHCLQTQEQTEDVRFYPFAYEDQPWESTQSYPCGKLLVSYDEYDLALIECQGSPGRDLGFVELDEYADQSYGGDVYVLHQNCDYWSDRRCNPVKLFSPGSIVDATRNVDSGAQRMDIFYNADTLGGSSGSPVFSGSSHKVIALHHNGHGKTPWSDGRGLMNSGVPMKLIVAFINKNFPSVLGTKNSLVDDAVEEPVEEPDTPIEEPKERVFGLTSLGTYKGELPSSEFNDFYAFRLNNLKRLSFTLTGEADFDLYFYDSEGNLLAKSEDFGRDEFTAVFYPGTYYAQVKAHEGQGVYFLRVQ